MALCKVVARACKKASICLLLVKGSCVIALDQMRISVVYLTMPIVLTTAGLTHSAERAFMALRS
jgi:hypothetical protein